MFLKEVMETIYSLADGKNKKIYLVGGFLRDLYLGNPGRDLDFAVNGNAMSLAQEASEILRGTYIPLDRINRVARVVLDYQGTKWQIDFSAFKGLTIEEDLASRDFTINSIGLELSAYLRLFGDVELASRRAERLRWHESLIDLCDGLADIENKTIRATNEYVFQADPIRIMRAVRLAGKLKFNIVPETFNLMRENCWLLQEVAGERIWEELLGILILPESYPFITMLDDIGALSEIFPVEEIMKIPGQDRHADNVWTHSLKTYKFLEELCQDPGSNDILTAGEDKELRGLLKKHLEHGLLAGRKRVQLIKLAALFHDPGKASTAIAMEDGKAAIPDHSVAGLVYVAEIARRLKMSRAEEIYLKNLTRNHMYPLSLFVNQPAGPADIRRFFTRLGKDVPDVLLLSLADLAAALATGGNSQNLARYRTFARDLLKKYYFEAETYIHPPVLVKGEDLMEALELPPSKKLGELLEKISEAQVRGEVKTKEEAIAYATRLLKE